MSPLRSVWPWFKRGLIPTTLAIGLVLSSTGGTAGAIPLVAGIQGGFEHDGNQVFDDADIPADPPNQPFVDAVLDWEDTDPMVIVDTPSATGDTSIAGDDDDPDDLDCAPTGGNVPSKADLLRAYLNTRIVGNEVFLDLAWVRNAFTGNDPSSNVVYEFNQVVTPDAPADVDGDCPITRTEGDLLVTYDFGGPNTGEIRLWSWDESGDEWDEMADVPEDAANGSVNGEDITIDDIVFDNFTPVADDNNLTEFRFGEATINLTATFTPPTGGPVSCETFGQTRVRSRTNGNNFNSLSDRLPATSFNVSTCGSITIEKQVVGGVDPGDTDFTFDPSAGVEGGGTFALEDGESDTFSVQPGAHTFVETLAEAPANIDDYATTIECTGGGSSTANNGTRTVEVTVAIGEHRTCVYTNTRETGRLSVVKEIEGDSGSDSFDLYIDSDLVADDAGDGEGSTPGPFDTGTYTVSEQAGTDTNLDNYGSSIECVDTANNNAVVASDDDTDVDVDVTDGSAIVCTITNSRETGRLSVVKQIEGDSGTDSFDLYIDSDLVADDAGDGEGSTPASYNTGSHVVSEQAGTDTNLDNYTSSLECVDEANNNTVVTSSPGTSLEVPVGAEQAIVCTFTNVRETGRLSIIKDIVGDSGDDSFDLLLDGSVVFDDAGDQDRFDTTANTGTYTVSEAAGTDTVLDDYTSSIECRNAADEVVATDDDTDVDVTLGTDEAIVCTITNLRETGRLSIIKDIQGDSGDDSFDLLLDGTVVFDDAGDQDRYDTTVNTGTYTVSEAAGTDTVLDDYTSSIECRNAADDVVASGSGTSLEVALGSDEAIVCTIFNSRDTGRLTVIKQLEPAGDPGLFNLLIDGAVEATDVGDEGSTEAKVVNTGIHSVGEEAGTGTVLADYTSSLECVDAADSVVPSVDGQVTINEGDAIVCTFTNVAVPKEGTIIIKKVADEYDADEAFPFSADFDGDANDGTDFSLEAGEQQEFVLLAGTYKVNELVPAGWDLVSAVCSDQSPVNAIVLAAEETVTCTFTNEKEVYDQYPGDPDFDFDTPFDDA